MILKDEWKRKLVGRNISPEPPFPAKLKIDICGCCNHGCVFCPNAIQKKNHGNIDDTLFRQIITDAYTAGTRELSISGNGEALLNLELEEYISHAKIMGYEYVFINTNGVLLNKKRAQALLKSGLNSVKFSINAGDAATYCLIHGSDCFDKVIENIRTFDEQRILNGNNCRLYVSFVAIKETLNQAKKLSALISEHVDEIVVMHANTRGGTISVEDSMLGNDSFSFPFPCGQLFDTATVLAEGYMVICCQDFNKLTVVADLNNMSITDAWNCEKFVNFRKKYLEEDFAGTLCNNCLFGGTDPVVPLTPDVAHYPLDEQKVEDREKRIAKLQKDKAQ